jgi:uncharacterized membrane protein
LTPIIAAAQHFVKADAILTEAAKQLTQRDMSEAKQTPGMYGSERLIAFSDAVMAVAITLLVLDLKLPEGVSDAELPAVVAGNMHALWCYVLSFLVIGLLWMAHHRQFSYIRRTDGNLLWINLFYLLTIGFIPYVTSVMSDHSIALPTMVYAGVLTVTCLLAAAMWGYASSAGLMSADVSAVDRRAGLLTPLMIAGVFALSIGVAALWGSGAGQWTWLLALPAGYLAHRLSE